MKILPICVLSFAHVAGAAGLLFATLLGPVDAQASAAEIPRLLWSDHNKLKSASDCQTTTVNENPFRVVEHAIPGTKPFETFVADDRSGVFKVPDKSLVALKASSDRDVSEVQVIAIAQNRGGQSESRLASPLMNGTLRSGALRDMAETIIAFDSKAPHAIFKNAPKNAAVKTVPLKQTFWQASMEGDEYVILSCKSKGKNQPRKNYFAFDVYATRSSTPIARIGVSPEESSVFRSTQALTVDEAEKMVSEQSRSRSLAARVTNTSRIRNVIEEASFDSEDEASSDPAPSSQSKLDEALGNDKELGGKMSDVLVPIILGPIEFILCSPLQTMEILGDQLDKVIYVAKSTMSVRPVQSFDAQKKTIVKAGKKIEYVQVQFKTEKGETKTGWVQNEYMSPKTKCPLAATENKSENTPEKKSGPPQPKKPDDYGNIRALSDENCCYFPLSHRPTESYREGMRMFRANRYFRTRRGRRGVRLHAACDLYGKDSEPVFAVAPGRVLRDMYYFYQEVYALEVVHSGGFVVRYGEIYNNDVGLHEGSKVKTGQTVGYMGTVSSGCCEPMLHFELYSGQKTGSLSQKTNAFQRRSDLLNPTEFLSKWEEMKFEAR